MISTLENKILTIPVTKEYGMAIDGPLGGCGVGEVGDPRTFLPNLWREVIDKYGIASVLDVGCGLGYSTRWFEQQGLKATGIEGSEPIAQHAVASDVIHHDFRLGKPPVDLLDDEYDLAWCSEFLEHVEAYHEPCYMDALCRCEYLLIAAAPPGFAGHNHVNCRDSAYWIDRITSYGYELLQDETNRLRRLSNEHHADCYFQGTGLFFRRVRKVSPALHWSEVDGWLLPQEGLILQGLARASRVLEIGTYKGRSTLAMASTAKQVTTIDTHEGDPETGPRDTLGEFLANVHRSGLGSRIEEIVGKVEDVAPEIRKRRFELVFIDGRHDAESVEHDTRLAMDVILPGGTIAWHDWDYDSVVEGVRNAGLDPNAISMRNGLGILETAKWGVMVTLPHSRGVELQAYKSVRNASIGRFTAIAGEMDMACGSLTHNFNTLLSQCLTWRDEGRLTHLAMIHSDITAERGWLDLLAEEMHQHDMVALSAVVAIKDPDNDRTSTAIGSKANPWEPVRYIHLKDYGRLPVTFTGKDVCENNDEVLLINTGLMLLDLRCEFWDSFHFEVLNRIHIDEEGKRRPQFRPEDWEMSRLLDAAGLRYGATWRPMCDHIGERSWTNRPNTVQVVEHRD